jgi:hypothetical protein
MVVGGTGRKEGKQQRNTKTTEEQRENKCGRVERREIEGSKSW